MDKLYQYRPNKALVYTAVINGIIAVPILFTIMKIANDKKILEIIPTSYSLMLLDG